MQFLTNMAYVLPSVIIWWAIAYLLVIKRKKVRVGGGLTAISIIGPALLMAWLKGRGFDDPVLTPLVLCIISCSLLRSLYAPSLVPPDGKAPPDTNTDSKP